MRRLQELLKEGTRIKLEVPGYFPVKKRIDKIYFKKDGNIELINFVDGTSYHYKDGEWAYIDVLDDYDRVKAELYSDELIPLNDKNNCKGGKTMDKKACYYCGDKTADYEVRIEYDGKERITCQKCLNTCFWIEHDDRPDSYFVPLTCDHCGAELGAFIDPAESSIGEVYCWSCLNFNFQGWDADLSHLRNKR